MLQADDLRQNHVAIEGQWVVAKPFKQPLYNRIKDAWQVVVGKAEAVIFYKQ